MKVRVRKLMSSTCLRALAERRAPWAVGENPEGDDRQEGVLRTAFREAVEEKEAGKKEEVEEEEEEEVAGLRRRTPPRQSAAVPLTVSG